ncbi:MAG: AI-2E family transporter [Sarcina sp.]
MFFKDLKLKTYIILSTYILILGAILVNFSKLTSLFSWCLDIISPFIWAIGIAFVLNLLMKFFDNKVLKFIDKSSKPKIRAIKRPISILLSLLTVIAVLTGVIIFVIPQLIESVSKLGENIPAYLMQLEKLVEKLLKNVNSAQLNEMFNNILNMWKEILGVSTQVLTSFLSNVIDITLNVTTSIFDIFLAIIFAIYMLANKEQLTRQCKKILYAFFPKKVANKTLEVAKIANKTYASFITGQCIEAVIVGTLCFLGMTILRLPYAFLIGTLVGTTSIIPIFGAFIGTIPSLFILFMVSPIKALTFLIFILVLQQIEGNFIYPRVVGNSVGLSSLWVTLAILIGTSVYGIVGIFIGIPLFAVLYKVFGDITNKRLSKRKIDIEKVNDEIEEIVDEELTSDPITHDTLNENPSDKKEK